MYYKSFYKTPLTRNKISTTLNHFAYYYTNLSDLSDTLVSVTSVTIEFIVKLYYMSLRVDRRAVC